MCLIRAFLMTLEQGNYYKDIRCSKHASSIHVPLISFYIFSLLNLIFKFNFISVHGNWSSWSPWPNCNKPCNGGIRTRKRMCDNPEPAFGGNNCTGPANETEPCNLDSCPRKYTFPLFYFALSLPLVL